jgi:HSP20 family protein
MLPALPPPRLTADIYETAGGEAFVIEIPVPGLKSDEIVIDVTSDNLTVSTRPQRAESESNRRYLQREQPVGPLSRLFEFPEEIDTDQVQATLENGILKIHAPKAAAGRRKVIRLGQSA